MQKKLVWAVAVAAAVAGLAGGGVAVASTADDDERPITGAALEQATAAALEHTGGGRVSDTEVGDEESYYEVEVTRADGTEVDVQLDRQFVVVGDEADDSDKGESGE